MSNLKNKDTTLFGTVIYDFNKKSIGIVINTWDNTFSTNGGNIDIKFATCVDSEGKKYCTEFDNLTPFEDLLEEQKSEIENNREEKCKTKI